MQVQTTAASYNIYSIFFIIVTILHGLIGFTFTLSFNVAKSNKPNCFQQIYLSYVKEMMHQHKAKVQILDLKSDKRICNHETIW